MAASKSCCNHDDCENAKSFAIQTGSYLGAVCCDDPCCTPTGSVNRAVPEGKTKAPVEDSLDETISLNARLRLLIPDHGFDCDCMGCLPWTY